MAGVCRWLGQHHGAFLFLLFSNFRVFFVSLFCFLPHFSNLKINSNFLEELFPKT